MPPKTKKDLELEAQRIAEEEKRREEEEKKLLEEQKKKYEILHLDTGLQCVFTDYFMSECYANNDNPRTFTRQFLSNYYMKENNYLQNFREIDWTVVVEFTLYNLHFAKNQLDLTH